jgi:hypothetical protein
MNRGKLTVVAMFVLAAAAAGYAVWMRAADAPRAIAFWGADTAQLLANAPQVSVRRVLPKASDGSEEQRSPSGEPVHVGPPRDLSTIRDLTYIRKALLNDKYFAWDEPVEDCEPHWVYVLRFQDQDAVATVWVDDHCDVVQLGENPKAIAKMPQLLNSIRTKFLDHYAIPIETRSVTEGQVP